MSGNLKFIQFERSIVCLFHGIQFNCTNLINFKRNTAQKQGNDIIISQFMRFWYLSQSRPVKAQRSLHVHPVMTEPSLLAHTKYESR